MVVFYLALGAGILLLLLSMVVGEILDFLDAFDGAISGTAVGSGLTLFGASGIIVLSNGGPTWMAYALAAALGGAALVVAGHLAKSLKASSVQAPHEVTGLGGIAYCNITSTDGEVQLTHVRELNRRLAFSDTPIPAGSSIIVTAVHGTRVKVSPVQPTTDTNESSS